MSKWKILGNIAAVALLGGVLGYYNFVDKVQEGLKAGEVCPDFSAQIFKVEEDTFTLSEERFTLSANEDTVCVINFWEKWCTGCVEEMPEFNEIYEHYEGKVQVLAAVGKTSTVPIAEEWLNQKGWTQVSDSHDWADFSLSFVYMPAELCVELGCVGGELPRTVIVNKRGYVEFEKDGKMSYDELRGVLDKLV